MFVTARGRQWIIEGKKPGSIREETYNKSGAGLLVDQLQSDQSR